MSGRSRSIRPPRDAVLIDPATPTTVYASALNEGLFKTTGGGATWSAINTGLSSLYGMSLAMHPAQSQTLSAGSIN